MVILKRRPGGAGGGRDHAGTRKHREVLQPQSGQRCDQVTSMRPRGNFSKDLL